MNNEFRSSIENAPTEVREKPTASQKFNDKRVNNIIDLLSGGKSVTELADSLNLNSELTEKVLIPLANMVQKYNVGASVAQSKTGQAAGDLVSVLGDVAPIIQGLTDYLAGQRKQLEDEDLAYLEAIKSAQSSGDLSSLFADDELMTFGEELKVEEEVDIEIDTKTAQRQEVEKTLGASLPDDWDVTQGIDWEEVLGAKPKQISSSTLGYGSYEEIEAEADRLTGRGRVSEDYDLSKGLSLDPTMAPVGNAFLSMDELIAAAGLSPEDTNTIKTTEGGFGTSTTPPTVLVKDETPTDDGVLVELTDVSVDMSEFMVGEDVVDDTLEEADEIVYLSDEEVDELRSEGFVFDEVESKVEDAKVDSDDAED